MIFDRIYKLLLLALGFGFLALAAVRSESHHYSHFATIERTDAFVDTATGEVFELRVDPSSGVFQILEVRRINLKTGEATKVMVVHDR